MLPFKLDLMSATMPQRRRGGDDDQAGKQCRTDDVVALLPKPGGVMLDVPTRDNDRERVPAYVSIGSFARVVTGISVGENRIRSVLARQPRSRPVVLRRCRYPRE